MYSQQVPGKLATMLMVVLCLTVLQNTATAQTISNSCSGANQITVGNCTNNQDANRMYFRTFPGWLVFLCSEQHKDRCILER